MMTQTIRIGNITYLVQSPIAEHINYLEKRAQKLEAEVHVLRNQNPAQPPNTNTR